MKVPPPSQAMKEHKKMQNLATKKCNILKSIIWAFQNYNLGMFHGFLIAI